MAVTAPLLVGRVEELERLRDNAARARSGQRATVLVDGEAGIGKSRLVAEAVTRMRGADDLVVVGHGVELSGGELPYGMASECLRSLVREAGVEEVRSAAGESAAALAALCPPLSPQVSPVEPTQMEQALLFYGFVTMLESLASDRLVWLVLEDLHWADASSRDLLSYLIKVAAPCRLATLITVRTHDPAAGPAASDIVADLVRVDGVERISIGALTREEVAEQIATLTHAPAPPALVDRVVELARGVPFLTEQLIAAGLTESGSVPGTVLEPMQARLRTLDPDTQRVVQIASLADGHLTHDLLEEAYQLETSTEGEDSFGWAVATAVDAQVLRFDPNEHTYTFVHALLRQAADAMVLPLDRRRWHRNLATLCAAQSYGQSGDPQLRIAAAHHWALAGADVQAFEAALDVAAQCHRLGAMGEMATLLCRALKLWDGVPDAAERAGRSRELVVADAVVALTETTDVAGAVSLLDGEVARTFGADDRILSLCLRLERDGIGQELGRNPDQALYEEAVASLDGLLSAAPSPWVINGIIDISAHVRGVKPELCLRILRHAATLAGELGDLRLRAWTIMHTALELSYQGGLDDAIAMLSRFLQGSSDSSVAVAEVEEAYGVFLRTAGRYRDAEAVFERALMRLRDPRFAQQTWADATRGLCEVHFALGRWDLEEDLLDRLVEVPSSPGSRTHWTAEVAVTLACHRGDPDTAERRLAAAWLHRPPDEEEATFSARLTYRYLLAQIAVARGELTTAREHLAPLWQVDETVLVPPRTWLPLLLAAQIEAEISDLPGRTLDSTSEAVVAAIRAIAGRVPKAGRHTDAWSAHLDAELAHAAGRDEPEAWAEVVSAWRSVGHIPYLAFSLMRLGASHLALGNRDSAAAPLSEAFRTASDLGAEPLRLRVIGLAHRGQLRLDDGTDSQRIEAGRLARLTSREVEVLRLVAQGMSNNEIAQKLFISPKTASVHVSRILTKLGVNSRAKATAVAYEERLLTDSQ